MDDLASKWEWLSLKAKEHDIVNLLPIVESNNRVLVARLFTKCRVNLEALTRTLNPNPNPKTLKSQNPQP